MNARIQLLPWLASLLPDFDFPSCSFENKRSTARHVVFSEFKVLYSYTIETSFHKSDSARKTVEEFRSPSQLAQQKKALSGQTPAAIAIAPAAIEADVAHDTEGGTPARPANRASCNAIMAAGAPDEGTSSRKGSRANSECGARDELLCVAAAEEPETKNPVVEDPAVEAEAAPAEDDVVPEAAAAFSRSFGGDVQVGPPTSDAGSSAVARDGSATDVDATIGGGGTDADGAAASERKSSCSGSGAAGSSSGTVRLGDPRDEPDGEAPAKAESAYAASCSGGIFGPRAPAATEQPDDDVASPLRASSAIVGATAFAAANVRPSDGPVQGLQAQSSGGNKAVPSRKISTRARDEARLAVREDRLQNIRMVVRQVCQENDEDCENQHLCGADADISADADPRKRTLPTFFSARNLDTVNMILHELDRRAVRRTLQTMTAGVMPQQETTASGATTSPPPSPKMKNRSSVQVSVASGLLEGKSTSSPTNSSLSKASSTAKLRKSTAARKRERAFVEYLKQNPYKSEGRKVEDDAHHFSYARVCGCVGPGVGYAMLAFLGVSPPSSATPYETSSEQVLGSQQQSQSSRGQVEQLLEEEWERQLRQHHRLHVYNPNNSTATSTKTASSSSTSQAGQTQRSDAAAPGAGSSSVGKKGRGGEKAIAAGAAEREENTEDHPQPAPEPIVDENSSSYANGQQDSSMSSGPVHGTKQMLHHYYGGGTRPAENARPGTPGSVTSFAGGGSTILTGYATTQIAAAPRGPVLGSLQQTGFEGLGVERCEADGIMQLAGRGDGVEAASALPPNGSAPTLGAAEVVAQGVCPPGVFATLPPQPRMLALVPLRSDDSPRPSDSQFSVAVSLNRKPFENQASLLQHRIAANKFAAPLLDTTILDSPGVRAAVRGIMGGSGQLLRTDEPENASAPKLDVPGRSAKKNPFPHRGVTSFGKSFGKSSSTSSSDSSDSSDERAGGELAGFGPRRRRAPLVQHEVRLETQAPVPSSTGAPSDRHQPMTPRSPTSRPLLTPKRVAQMTEQTAEKRGLGSSLSPRYYGRSGGEGGLNRVGPPRAKKTPLGLELDVGNDGELHTDVPKEEDARRPGGHQGFRDAAAYSPTATALQDLLCAGGTKTPSMTSAGDGKPLTDKKKKKRPSKPIRWQEFVAKQPPWVLDARGEAASPKEAGGESVLPAEEKVGRVVAAALALTTTTTSAAQEAADPEHPRRHRKLSDVKNLLLLQEDIREKAVRNKAFASLHDDIGAAIREKEEHNATKNHAPEDSTADRNKRFVEGDKLLKDWLGDFLIPIEKKAFRKCMHDVFGADGGGKKAVLDVGDAYLVPSVVRILGKCENRRENQKSDSAGNQDLFERVNRSDEVDQQTKLREAFQQCGGAKYSYRVAKPSTSFLKSALVAMSAGGVSSGGGKNGVHGTGKRETGQSKSQVLYDELQKGRKERLAEAVAGVDRLVIQNTRTRRDKVRAKSRGDGTPRPLRGTHGVVPREPASRSRGGKTNDFAADAAEAEILPNAPIQECGPVETSAHRPFAGDEAATAPATSAAARNIRSTPFLLATNRSSTEGEIGEVRFMDPRRDPLQSSTPEVRRTRRPARNGDFPRPSSAPQLGGILRTRGLLPRPPLFYLQLFPEKKSLRPRTGQWDYENWVPYYFADRRGAGRRGPAASSKFGPLQVASTGEEQEFELKNPEFAESRGAVDAPPNTPVRRKRSDGRVVVESTDGVQEGSVVGVLWDF
eukprot:g3712.t1